MIPDSLPILPPVMKLLTLPVVPVLLAKIVAPTAVAALVLPASALLAVPSVAARKFMAQAGHRQSGINE